MKVHELITMLLVMPLDHDVVIEYDGSQCDVTGVKHSNDYRTRRAHDVNEPSVIEVQF